jgi:polysaccharide deacetylase family protein (PEP-CTERM system associated)
MNPSDIVNIMTVDVEDYHNQLAMDFQNRIVPPDEEAVRTTDELLAILDEYRVRGTFFILGEIAEYFPELVQRIAGRGHQLGVHGYYHHRAFLLTPEQFRQSIERAKKRIEDLTGKEANAHRAVAFSIGEGTMWALDILADLGFKYDSSFYPFRGRSYGLPTGPRGPYQNHLPGGRWIWEVPLSTVVWMGRRWPVCGGGYLRHFPLSVTVRAMRRLHAEGLPAVVYVHPYELEVAPDIEPLPGMSLRDRMKFAFFNYHQVRQRKHTRRKLRYLLANYLFGAIDQVVGE